MKIFFPEVSRPTRTEVQDALEKVYPGCKVSRFDMTSYEPGEPMLTMGEEVEEVDEAAGGIIGGMSALMKGAAAAKAVKGISTGAKIASAASALAPLAKAASVPAGAAAAAGALLLFAGGQRAAGRCQVLQSGSALRQAVLICPGLSC